MLTSVKRASPIQRYVYVGGRELRVGDPAPMRGALQSGAPLGRDARETREVGEREAASDREPDARMTERCGRRPLTSPE